MAFRGWRREKITTDAGNILDAACPVIISASRATDLPAFYADWFMKQLHAGYIIRPNPFNAAKPHCISFSDTRLIVFWTKNPEPLMKFLPKLDDMGLNYYFQFTLNDYENCSIEPNLPHLHQRIDTFIRLSKQIGRERLIWRFDPLILTNTISPDSLLERITEIAKKIAPYTEKLVFSFADISGYRRVQSNLARSNIRAREFSTEEILYFAEELEKLNQRWNLKLATCAEKIDLSNFGIEHNRCIDDNLIVRLFSQDSKLMHFMQYHQDMLGGHHCYIKDPGQRSACGCMVSRDIGSYNTCQYRCAYCYANTIPQK